MTRKQFPVAATEMFVRWLEAQCGADVIDGLNAMIEAERQDVGKRIEKQLVKTRHYHGQTDIDLHDADVLTANRVLSVVRTESGLVQRKP